MDINIKRSDFYNELPKEKQIQYFYRKDHKFIATIDNLYYSVFLQDDTSDNFSLRPLLEWFSDKKEEVIIARQPYELWGGLFLDLKSYEMYKYCLSKPDLYDIFVSDYLPNQNTPRIVVQLRASGLWNHGMDEVLLDSFDVIKDLFGDYRCQLDKCRESRIDYCYHTNEIKDAEKIFSDSNLTRQMSTTLKRWHQTGRVEYEDGHAVLRKDYFALGERKSNNVFVRCYNKALEVIEGGYKGFFFKLWQKEGLISMYDRYCFECAYEHRNYDYVHKAKLQFYLEYGTDEQVKKEFHLILNDRNSTMETFKTAAKSYMPDVTNVTNIEYETKRKFYYYSDKFIEAHLHTSDRKCHAPLKRIYKIIDNRAIFLDYLTSKTYSMRRNEGEYSPWWNRLRNTKLEGLKVDEKLIREYSTNLDERLIKAKIINSVASVAVYGNKIESDFMEDMSDMLSNLNDNDANKLQVNFSGNIQSKLLNGYQVKKEIKEKRLRNRIKKDNQLERTEPIIKD